MLELGIKLLLSYLLGSLNGSLIIGKFIGVDIRSVGSGNAGGTNALRTQGARFAMGVMLIDIGKGFLPAWLLPTLVLPGVPLDPEISRSWLMFACGAASVVGHCYPVWFNFRGGKGAATLIGMLIAAAPWLLLYGLLVFAGIIVLTGFVGLATMSAVTALPIVLLLKGELGSSPAVIILSLLALFIIYMHRANIARMIRGEEHRMHKVMLFGRRQQHEQN